MYCQVQQLLPAFSGYDCAMGGGNGSGNAGFAHDFVGETRWVFCCLPSGKLTYNVRPPSYVCRLTKAPVTIVISTINHSYWGYKPTERYLGGLTL